MKWLGQYIQDLPSRFRDDVYLEDLSTTTETNVLVVDSTGKVSKSTTLADDIIEEEIDTLTNLISIGDDSATTNILAGDLTMYNAVNDGNPTISLGSSATDRLEIKATYNSGNQQLCDIDFTTYTASGTANDGRFNWYVDEVLLSTLSDTGFFVYGDGKIQATSNGAMLTAQDTTTSSGTEGGKLRLMANDGAAMGDDHRLGVIEFYGAEDASNTNTIGARIEAMCDAGWSASENGARLDFYTTDGNASESKVLTLDSDKLATFTGAVTIAGALTMGSTAAMTNAGLLSVANQTGVTGLGTISSGVWNGTAIASAYIADDAVTFAKAVGVTPNVYGTTIKVLPSDFMANEEGGVTKTIQFVDDTASGLKAGNANTELLAFVAIPEGMKATLVDVYDNSHNLAVAVFEVDINSAGITSKGTGNANTQVDITDVNATATNFLMIQVTTTALSHRIFGALVTIAAQ